MRRIHVVAVALIAGLILACASGGEAGKSAPRDKGKAKAPKAHWELNHERVKGDALVGAVMDLWGGDPGTLCFIGEPKFAVRRVKKVFEGNDALVAVKADGPKVVITTKSPFGGDETSDATFTPCP